MRALAAVARIPGAPMLLPLVAGMSLVTVGADPTRLGPFTGGLGDDAVGFVSVLLVCVGAQITPRSVRPVAGRLGVVLAGATVVPAALIVAYAALFGAPGFGGLSVAAVAAAGLCTSNALWLALARRFGSPEDAWGGSVASIINSAPAVPLALLMLLRHDSGTLPWRGLLDAVLPLAVGIAAGMIVPACRATLVRAIPVLLVIVSFSLGLRLDMHPAVHELPAGLALGLVTALVSGGLVAAGWRLVLRRPPTVGWAAAGTAVTIPLMPGIFAAADPAWTPYVPQATAQLGIALVVSTFAAPALTAASARWHRTRVFGDAEQEVVQPADQAVPNRSLRAARGIGAHR